MKKAIHDRGFAHSMSLAALTLFLLLANTLEASRSTRSKQVKGIRRSLQALTIDREASARTILDKYEMVCNKRLAQEEPIYKDTDQHFDERHVEFTLYNMVEIEKVDIVSACQVIRNDETLGSLNPTELFQRSFEMGYSRIVQCLQLVPLSGWDDLGKAHLFLASIYKTETYDAAFWHRRWSESNYPDHMWTVFAANNRAFLNDMENLPSINNQIRGPLFPSFFESLGHVIRKDASETLHFMLNKVPPEMLFDSIDTFAKEYNGPKCLTLLYKFNDKFAKEVMLKAIKYGRAPIIRMIMADEKYKVGAAEFDEAFRCQQYGLMSKIFHENMEAVMGYICDLEKEADATKVVHDLIDECDICFTDEQANRVHSAGKIKAAKIMRDGIPSSSSSSEGAKPVLLIFI